MSKFSIFTSFLSVILIIIVAELMVNEYLVYPEMDKEVLSNVLNEEISDEIPAGEILEINEIDKNTVPIINFELLGNAGSTGLTLQRVPFNGILYESIDLRDFVSVPVVKQNLLQNNRRQIGIFHEFHGESRLVAKEIYLLLKDKAFQLSNASINETNGYGDGSFYINYTDRKSTAFLVVKLNNNVYAFSYEKDFHTFIENIVALLP